MAKFDYGISHVPGRLLFTADALSRDPIPEHEPSTLQKETEVFVNSLTRTLPASEQRLEMYCKAQERDEVWELRNARNTLQHRYGGRE